MTFFVQESSKEPWHVESADDCEYMLCGRWISIEVSTVRVQSRWGPRRCPDCWMLYEKGERIARTLG